MSHISIGVCSTFSTHKRTSRGVARPFWAGEGRHFSAGDQKRRVSRFPLSTFSKIPKSWESGGPPLLAGYPLSARVSEN